MAGFNDLFREIGNTLGDAATQGVRSGVATLRQAIARDAINSPEGQQVVADYKMSQVQHYAPWIIGIIVLIFLIGHKVRI